MTKDEAIVLDQVRAPHGSGSGESGEPFQATISAGTSTAAIAIPYGTTRANTARPWIVLRIAADQNLDIRVRFGTSSGMAAATANDWLIPAGGFLDLTCYKSAETHFRIYQAGGPATVASYYMSGFEE